MAESLCTTCDRPLSQCDCPVPEPPTFARIGAFKATRDALLRAVGSTPHQDDPLVRAQVQAAMDRILAADETTIHRMAQTLGVGRYRRRAPKHDPAEVFTRRVRIRQEFFEKHDRWPTLTEEAGLLGIPRRTLYRYLHPNHAKKSTQKS